MRFPTRSDFYWFVRGVARHEDHDIGKPVVRAPGVSKAIIPAAYAAGNPKIQQWHESGTTLGTKTHKILQAYGNRFAAPAASDSIAIGHDPDGNKEILGKIVNVGSGVTDAEYIMGLRPVTTGNTLLSSSDAEVNESSATFADHKKFHVDRKGLYRVKCELSRDSGIAEARLVRKLRDGTVVVVSGSVTENTATYPTFSATKTIDMTVTSGWDDVIYFQLKNQGGAANAYAQNVRTYYADASASITPLDFATL